jgi:geranylgeranylglycerol-phosphate geranylgeranyltransferase
MAAVGVWLGGYLSNGMKQEPDIFFASLAAALVCGGGNALNDYLDIESDKINHPRRPLPSGDLPPYMAIIIVLVFNIAAIVSAILVDSVVLVIVVCAIVALAVYDFRLKKLPLIGNLIVSILGGMTFIVGGLAIDKSSIFILPGVMIPAVFAFLFHLGRELLKDIADFDGDIKTDCRTLVSIMSRKSVMIFISVLYSLLILLTLIPIFEMWYRPIYGYIAVGLVDIPLGSIIFYIWWSKSTGRFPFGGKVLKLLMVFGLLAFYFGKI